jgi:hypothetical protein
MGLPLEDPNRAAVKLSFEFIPISFIDAATKEAVKKGKIVISPKTISFKSRNFLNEFYGRNVSSDFIKSKSNHFKYSLVRQVSRRMDFAGFNYTSIGYERLNLEERADVLEVDSL